MSDYSKKLAKGTAIIVLITFISALVGYGQKFVFARTIDVSEIGLFYSVLGFVMFFSFLRDLGLSDSLVYFIPRFLVEKNKEKIKSSIIFTTLVQISSSIFFFLLILLFSSFLSQHYFKDSRATSLLIFLAIYFLLDGIVEVLFRVFHSYQDMLLSHIISLVFQIISFILFVAVIYLKFPITFLGLSYVTSAILVVVIFFIVFIKKTFPAFLKTKYKITKNFVKKMFGYSIPTMLGSLGHEIIQKTSIFFLTLFVGLQSVGFYVMARSIGKITIYFFKSLIRVFFPMMSEMWKKKDTKNLSFYLDENIRFSYLVGLPVCVFIIIYSKEILNLLYGEAFIGASLALKLFAIYFIFYSYNSLLKRVFLSTGNPKIAMNITYVGLFLILTFNLILTPKFGLIGAVVAELLSGFGAALYSTYLVRRLKFKLPKKTAGKLALGTIFFTSFLLVLKKIISLPVIYEVFVSGTIAFVLYLLLVLILKLLTWVDIKLIFETATQLIKTKPIKSN